MSELPEFKPFPKIPRWRMSTSRDPEVFSQAVNDTGTGQKQISERLVRLAQCTCKAEELCPKCLTTSIDAILQRIIVISSMLAEIELLQKRVLFLEMLDRNRLTNRIRRRLLNIKQKLKWKLTPRKWKERRRTGPDCGSIYEDYST